MAASTPSHYSMRLRSKEPWTLGGRRKNGPRDRSAPAIPALAATDPGESWTFGGRRGPKPSPSWLTERPDQQELLEALYRTRTDDRLLTMRARLSCKSAL